jgi:hypothetical protein
MTINPIPNIDLEQRFNQYFNELESYALRSERFYHDYYHSDGSNPEIMVRWLRAAFVEGARVMAEHTVDVVSTVNDSSLVGEKLNQHYTSVFSENDFPSLDTIRQRCNQIVRAVIGDALCESWWNQANRAFEGRTPQEQWLRDPQSVYRYLLSFCG